MCCTEQTCFSETNVRNACNCKFIWRLPSLSELTPTISYMELTHLGPNSSIYCISNGLQPEIISSVFILMGIHSYGKYTSCVQVYHQKEKFSKTFFVKGNFRRA